MNKEFKEALPEGELELAVGETLHLEFGCLVLDISNKPFEWTVRYVYTRLRPERNIIEYGAETTRRFVFGKAHNTLRIAPMLADRAVVSKPLSPISLIAGSSTKVYISTPLWLGVCIGGNLVLELPTVRLSDTWFGSKMAGELCYSDSTRARLDPDAVENLYFKAVTPVTIRNQSSRQLLLDRINVPVTMLPLYRSLSDDRSFVTTSITATLNEGEEQTRVELGPASEQGNDVLISAGRKPHRKQFFYRAIDMLLS